MPSSSSPSTPSFEIENEVACDLGWKQVAGVDEAGRGPLAGPVVAAAAVIPRDFDLPFLNDSKKLTPLKRKKILEALQQHPRVSLAWAIASSDEIDALNILKATHLAMKRAVAQLLEQGKKIDGVLVDGLPTTPLGVPQRAVVKGDARSFSIAAASICAKVMRDELMEAAHLQWPQYQFSKHKGYPTALHLKLLAEHGPSPIHRQSFAPVAQQAFVFKHS